MTFAGSCLIVGALMGSMVAATTGETWQTPYFLLAGIIGVVLAVVGYVREH